MSGWGSGEWSDMAWGTGADYPYSPIVFLDAEGPLATYTKTGALASHSQVGRLTAPPQASGRQLVYAATGTIRS
jgi:hypothetical protein